MNLNAVYMKNKRNVASKATAMTPAGLEPSITTLKG